LDSLRVKRDDLTQPLGGSSKTRKLDYLLASEPWASASEWAAVGAIGSGQLVSLVSSAKLLDRRVRAYLFWQKPSLQVLASLAFVANGPTSLRYRSSRLALALSWPLALFGSKMGSAVVVPPGATCPIGTLGAVRGGLELARQLTRSDEPLPDRVYVAIGSGGTAVGFAIGLGLGGVRTEVHAVSVVERLFIGKLRLRRHKRQTMKLLRPVGLTGEAAPIVLRREFAEPAYGRGSDKSRAATVLLRSDGVPGDEVYTGKAFACLMEDAKSGAVKRPLLLMTNRSDALVGRPGGDRLAGATAASWLDLLPGPLQARLHRARTANGGLEE
jgi:D-cysteine desulfhydrase